MNASLVVGFLWETLGLIWLVGIVRNKRTVRRQSTLSRSLQLGLTLLAYFLLFSPMWHIGICRWKLFPQTAATNMAGILLTLAGCLLAIWARLILGRNWSMNVTVKQAHTLTTTGPYAFVRHPIYSGLLLMVLGTTMVFDRVSGVLALGVMFLGFWLKLHTEELFMEQEFGEQYVAYKYRVKALIPGVL
ncbi:MAG TPA: isoprenylcysteine carboxylmethyltransferase family protein [Acidobacteriaceae bacterium]|nr:isoprenylcysteine carboxylmethyltransferase family protein [Acidobacteriaceae bacterium]